MRISPDIHAAISAILYEDWAPLGWMGLLPDDEYDSYIDDVYALLLGGASCAELAKHLAILEHTLGDATTVGMRTLAAATKLCALGVARQEMGRGHAR